MTYELQVLHKEKQFRQNTREHLHYSKNRNFSSKYLQDHSQIFFFLIGNNILTKKIRVKTYKEHVLCKEA